VRTPGPRSIRSIWSSTGCSRLAASGAYRARARNDSISARTELIHPVVKRRGRESDACRGRCRLRSQAERLG
jgi:hypothetical protein